MADEESLRSLVERGMALTDRYLRAGPGSAGARPHLDEAITVLDRAYAGMEPGQTVRGQVAAQVGWLYGIRHLAHGGTERDRTTGIHLIDEALRFPNLPPVLRGSSKIILGQLLLAGVTAGLRSPDAIMRTMTGGAPRDLTDADRAVTLFREVAEGPPTSAEMVSTARTLLPVAEALRGMLGGPGGMDFSQMGAAFAAMQAFQRGGGMGPGSMPPIPDLAAFAAPVPSTTAAPAPSGPASGTPMANPFAERVEPDLRYADHPVAVVDGPMPEGGPLPSPRPRPWDHPSAAELRKQPAVTVDERVARAAAVVEAAGAEPVDRLVLAGALADRHDADGGSGWGDGRDDLRAAAEILNRIASELPGMHPDEVLTAVELAERIDEGLPGSTRLSDGYAEVATAMREAGIDAYVYPGSLALDARTGRLDRSPDGTRRMGRIVAALPADPALDADGAVVSYLPSAAGLRTSIGRGRRPITEDAVFVTNPRGDRDRATIDALRLRRRFYPRSAGLGVLVEDVDGPGRPDDVRARLDASLLHLGCGVTAAGALELAGPDELAPAAIAAGARSRGGVALLPPTPAPAPLVDALLARGYTAVIAFRAAVTESAASVIYWRLHGALADDSLDPASAVAAVRAWIRDPDRADPELSDAECRSVEPGQAAALICHGW